MPLHSIFICKNGSTQDGVAPEPGLPGEGRWWGPLLRANTVGDVDAHPFRCTVPTCNELYSRTGACATRARNHLIGKAGGGIAKCVSAKASDRSEASNHDSTLAAAAAANAQQPSSENRPAAEAAAGLAPMASSSIAVGSSSGELRPELELTPTRQRLLMDARDETIRKANLGGLFKHMMPKGEQEKLDSQWAAALASACLPINILENAFIRDAIFSTSTATALYHPPRRNLMELAAVRSSAGQPDHPRTTLPQTGACCEFDSVVRAGAGRQVTSCGGEVASVSRHGARPRARAPPGRTGLTPVQSR